MWIEDTSQVSLDNHKRLKLPSFPSPKGHKYFIYEIVYAWLIYFYLLIVMTNVCYKTNISL